MLTDGKQIAAARQLLSWSQATLAEKSGVSKPSIIRMEKDLFSVKDDSRRKIVDVINDSGVEFLEGKGLRENRKSIKRYRGQEGFHLFYDDLYKTAKEIGGDICIFNGVSNLITQWLGEDYLQIQIKRMLEIDIHFNFNVIVEEGDDVFFGADYCEYRWFPKHLFNDKTIYIYGSKVAFITFMDNDVEVIVLDQTELADCQKLFFELAWNYIAMEIETK